MNLLKLRYSGRISAGCVKKTSLEHKVPDKSEEQLYSELVFRVHGRDEALRLRDSLGLSNLPNSTARPKQALRNRRGLKGISSYGRQLVVDGALLIQHRYGRKRLSFLTLTLPSDALTPEIVRDWARLCKILLQRLTRHLQKHHLPQAITGVTEIQEHRQQTSGGLPALHLHLLFVGRHDRSGWAFSTGLIDKIWGETLSTIAGRHIEVRQACRIESVKKDASGYLGKYMSKGVSALSSINPEYCPASWYVCTLNVRRWVAKEVKTLQGKAATKMFDWLMERKDLLRFSKLVSIVGPMGNSIAVGWYGQLKDRQTVKLLREEIALMREHWVS